MTPTKRVGRLVAATTAAVVLVAAPAGGDILIEFDELIFGRDGTVQTVAEADVSPDLVGSTCQVSVIAENQASVHPGNDLIVSTGDSQSVVPGVEDEANGGTTAVFEVVVGPTIVVQLRFGPDEISSLGFDLSFDCDLPPATTTTTAVVTSTSTPVTTPDPTLDGQNQEATSTTVDGDVSPTSALATGQGSTDPTTAGASTTVPSANADQSGTPESTASTPGSTTPSTTGAPASTTTGPGAATEAPTTVGTEDLPPSPVARAIVAAPAYAG